MPGRNRYYKRKLYFSTNDRILLHLLDFVSREGEFNQPDEVTQFGIADSIRLGRSTVSKAIRRLEAEKLVKSRRAHVPSGKLRRTVYLLTDVGVQAANHRRLAVEEDVIAFRDAEGVERRLRVGQLPKLVPEYATLLDVATHVAEGVFDATTFQTRRGQKLVDLTDRVPRLRYFFGREPELAAMDAWLEAPAERVLVITGLTGIGKTTLLARKLEDWRERRHVFFHRLMPFTTVRNVAVQLGEFLARLSRKGLGQYLEAKEAVDIEQVVSILAADLNGVSAALVYDDYHNAEPAIRDFFYAWRDALERIEGIKLVVAGRYVPPFYDRRDVRVKGLVREMSLAGLDATSGERLLQTRNLALSPEAVATLLRRTGGHPLFLELVDFSPGSVAEDIHRYLNEELFSRITDAEAKVLTLASIFRHPVHADALYLEEDVDPNTIRGLVEQSLLREVSAKMYDVHDLVRSFFVEMSTPRDRRRYHRLAAQHYLSRPEPDSLEALYHLTEAGETKNAARLAVKEGRDILKAGKSEEMLKLLQRLLPAVEDSSQAIEVRLMTAQALDTRGELDDAIATCREIVQTAPGEEMARKVAEAHRHLGDIYRRQGQIPGANEELESALRSYRTADDGKGQAEVLHALGQLYEDVADFAKAERSYDRSRNLAEQLGMRDLEAQLEIARARLLMSRGELAEALEHKQRALAMAEALGDWHLLAKFQISMGTVLFSLKRYEEALRAYDQGIEIARRIGNLRMLAFGLYNAAGAYLRQDDFPKAEAYLRETTVLFRKLREPVMEALVQEKEGVLWAKRGKWPLAKQRLFSSLQLLRVLPSPADLVKDLISTSFYCQQNGEFETARQLLDEAESHARRIRMDGLVEEIQNSRRLLTGNERALTGSARAGAEGSPTA